MFDDEEGAKANGEDANMVEDDEALAKNENTKDDDEVSNAGSEDLEAESSGSEDEGEEEEEEGDAEEMEVDGTENGASEAPAAELKQNQHAHGQDVMVH